MATTWRGTLEWGLSLSELLPPSGGSNNGNLLPPILETGRLKVRGQRGPARALFRLQTADFSLCVLTHVVERERDLNGVSLIRTRIPS